MTSPVLPRIQEIAADIFSVPKQQITPESSPSSVDNWDSMQHVNLILALEQEFQVQFEPEEIAKMNSIALIATVVEGKLEQSGL